MRAGQRNPYRIQGNLEATLRRISPEALQEFNTNLEPVPKGVRTRKLSDRGARISILVDRKIEIREEIEAHGTDSKSAEKAKELAICMTQLEIDYLNDVLMFEFADLFGTSLLQNHPVVGQDFCAFLKPKTEDDTTDSPDDEPSIAEMKVFRA